MASVRSLSVQMIALILLCSVAVAQGSSEAVEGRSFYSNITKRILDFFFGSTYRTTSRFDGNNRYVGYAEEEDADPYGLSYILPVLAVAGLSMLFPNVITIETRKKRDIAGKGVISSDRLMEIYSAVTESDKCVQRVVCELGQRAGGAFPDDERRNVVIAILKKAAPKKYVRYLERFQEGASQPTKCSTINCPQLFS